MATTPAVVPRARRSRPWRVAPLVIAAFLLAAPWLGVSPYRIREILLISFMTLLISGFNLNFGYGGELALGQVAMYALGAYVAGRLAIEGADLSICLLAAGVAGAVLGALIAIPGIRLRGWGLAIASFFLILLIPDVVRLFEAQTGGYAGLIGVPPPKLFGTILTPNEYYLVIVGITLLWLACMRNIVTSRHGGALRVMRESPILAESLGINVPRLKVMMYALGAIPAALAGCLFVSLDLYISPGNFTVELAFAIVAGSVLGGSETVYGAIVGATILQLGPMSSTAFHEYAYVAYGVLLVAGGVFLVNGKPRLMRLISRLRRAPKAATVRAETPTDVDVLAPLRGERLVVRDIVKSFGGVHALEGVSIEALPGRITGLIGTNGSGKTTLLNIVSGFYKADAGTVELDDRVIVGRSPHRIARWGVARTFQTPRIPTSMTTSEVVASARYVPNPSSILAAILRLRSFRRCQQEDRSEAHTQLQRFGIEHLADAPAASLPLGSRRLVEVARALTAHPGVLLLDEPASGLDARDIDELVDAIRRVRDAGATIVLVEHNFKMVCGVADYIYVFDTGRLIAAGTPAEIQANQRVIDSYLGRSPAAEQPSHDEPTPRHVLPHVTPAPTVTEV